MGYFNTNFSVNIFNDAALEFDRKESWNFINVSKYIGNYTNYVCFILTQFLLLFMQLTRNLCWRCYHCLLPSLSRTHTPYRLRPNVLSESLNLSVELKSTTITFRKEAFYVLAYALTTSLNFFLTNYEELKIFEKLFSGLSSRILNISGKEV
jgi:hypothetical protein